MPRVNRPGFTLVELLVALAVAALALTAAFRLVLGAQRAYRTHAARMQLDQETRAAVAIVASELRQLDANDPEGSDLVAMSPAALTYRSTRGIRFLCQAPDTARRRVVVAADPAFGDRNVAGARRSLLVHAALDTASSPGGRWLRATAVPGGEDTPCPGGRAGTALTLSDVAPGELVNVKDGAPLRSQSLVRIQSYRDGEGEYWLGWKETGADGTWSDMQPFAGPVAAGGLGLVYYDSNGSVTSSMTDVAMIGIAITGRATRSAATLRLSTRVALRNSARP